ncbi:MAG: transcriptional repressor [Planctomycetes bacterium]|nr:transcriptional repressor [Planctomycetota bacterium]
MDRAIDKVRDALQARGLRLTKPRRLVAEKVLSARRHLAADDVLEMLRRDGTPVARATVYRTLEMMKECGTFDEHDFGRGRKVYERAIGRPHHDHLYCIGCGAIIEFQEPEIERLQDQVTRRYHFIAMYHSHKIFGYCRRCGPKAPSGDKAHDEPPRHQDTKND